MPVDIVLSIGDCHVPARLLDTRTARSIADSLPIMARFNVWGDEIYFSTQVSCPLDETAAEVVEKGAIGYWPPGKAFCVFYGPTPMSDGSEIKPASAVNIIGRVTGDYNLLKNAVSLDSEILVRLANAG